MPDRSPDNKELRDGRYVLLATLGQGAQGTTWDAVDKRVGRGVAIKEFDVRGARAWKDVELAEREARVLSELDHPMLPHYIEHFEEDGVLYLVMEKIEGTPLSVLQKKNKTIGEDEVQRLLRDADTVFAYLHGRNPPVIHRDIKPSNIIRRPDGSFAFVDFGAVRDRLRPEGGSTVVGTFGYMAPEQFQGRAGPGSDVYAVGATALALLTGQEPETLPHKGLSLDVKAALGGRTSQALTSALSRMLEADPDTRAKRIGPLLPSTSSARPRPRAQGWSQQRQDEWRASWDIDPSTRASRKAVRRAQRAARRAARDARRHGGSFHPPFLLATLASIVFMVARLSVFLVVQLAVPLVLTVLSLLFGSGLRRAARGIREVGAEADDAMLSARDRLSGKSEGEPFPSSSKDPRVRVVPPEARARSPKAGVRFEDSARLEGEEGEEEHPSASRRMKRP